MTTRETPAPIFPDELFLEEDTRLLQIGREWLTYAQQTYSEAVQNLHQRYPVPASISIESSEISSLLGRFSGYEGKYALYRTLVKKGRTQNHCIGYVFEHTEDGLRESTLVSKRGKEKRRIREITKVTEEGDSFEEVYEVRDISEEREHMRIVRRNLLSLPDGSSRPTRYSVVEDEKEVTSYWQTFQFDEKNRIVQEVLYGFGEGYREMFGLDTSEPILQVTSISYDDLQSVTQRHVQRMYVGEDHHFADPDKWNDFDTWVKVAKMMPTWETETTDYQNQTRTWGRSTMEARSQQLQLLGKIVPTVEKMAGISDTAARHYEELDAEMDKLQKMDWEHGDGYWCERDGIVTRFDINRSTERRTRTTEGNILIVSIEIPIKKRSDKTSRPIPNNRYDDLELSCSDKSDNWIHIETQGDAIRVFLVAGRLSSHMSVVLPATPENAQEYFHIDFHQGFEDPLQGDDIFIKYHNRGGTDTMVRIAKVPLVIG